jgi:hypothetical protein
VQVPCAVSSHVDGVRVRSKRVVYVLVLVDCCRHSMVVKSTILPSASVARRGEIAKD